MVTRNYTTDFAYGDFVGSFQLTQPSGKQYVDELVLDRAYNMAFVHSIIEKAIPSLSNLIRQLGLNKGDDETLTEATASLDLMGCRLILKIQVALVVRIDAEAVKWLLSYFALTDALRYVADLLGKEFFDKACEDAGYGESIRSFDVHSHGVDQKNEYHGTGNYL